MKSTVDSETSLAAYVCVCVCVFLENATHFDIIDSKSIKNLHAREGEGGEIWCLPADEFRLMSQK